MKAGIVTKLSPSFRMVSKYFAASVLSFLILNFIILLNYDHLSGHHFQPKILAVVHIATLGWITMIIFGALFQLIPVVLEVKLYSELMAEVQFWIYSLGTAGLIMSFWNMLFNVHLVFYAILLFIAVSVFTVNVALTLKSVRKWNLTATYLTAAVIYLFITAASGLLLSINLGTPFIKINHLSILKAHAHIGFIGWFMMIIMGVAYKLIPMFSLSHGYSTLPSKLCFPLVNAGLIGISMEMIRGNESVLYFSSLGILISGILLFLLQIFLILKNRVRKTFDTGLRFSVAAFSVVLLIITAGSFLAFVVTEGTQLQVKMISIYGYLILFGFISMLIKAQMYKIVPFLVWFHKYSSLVGIKAVPMLKDMFNEKIANTGFAIMILGIMCAIAGFFMSINLLLLAAFSLTFISAAIFASNMILIYRR